jgi:hypothetical protein
MSLPLTCETLAAAYDYLRTTPPFHRWNLPESEDIAWRVIKSRTLFGWYDCIDGQHIIAISEYTVGSTDMLMRVMAHEMVHLYEKEVRIDHHETQHTAAFVKLGQQVSRVHCFDPKAF